MSDWKTTELFLARSSAQYSAFAVGVAIAALGNRKDDGWTFASLDRIAKLARLDRRTANVAINELADSGELEYIPGTSRHNPSRYRIRTEILHTGIDRFRCPLTMDNLSTVTMDKLSTVTMENSAPTMENLSVDHGEFVNATMDHLSTPSVNRSVNRSLDQISDQSAREPARFSDPTKSWTRTEEDDRALSAAFEACRRAADTSAGEDGDPAVKLGDAVVDRLGAPVEPSLESRDWVEADDARRAATMAAGKQRKADFKRSHHGGNP
jgi:hypothetical protein